MSMPPAMSCSTRGFENRRSTSGHSWNFLRFGRTAADCELDRHSSINLLISLARESSSVIPLASVQVEQRELDVIAKDVVTAPKNHPLSAVRAWIVSRRSVAVASVLLSLVVAGLSLVHSHL